MTAFGRLLPDLKDSLGPMNGVQPALSCPDRFALCLVIFALGVKRFCKYTDGRESLSVWGIFGAFSAPKHANRCQSLLARSSQKHSQNAWCCGLRGDLAKLPPHNRSVLGKAFHSVSYAWLSGRGKGLIVLGFAYGLQAAISLPGDVAEGKLAGARAESVLPRLCRFTGPALSRPSAAFAGKGRGGFICDGQRKQKHRE
jgi:hypothetical protein